MNRISGLCGKVMSTQDLPKEGTDYGPTSRLFTNRSGFSKVNT